VPDRAQTIDSNDCSSLHLSVVVSLQYMWFRCRIGINKPFLASIFRFEILMIFSFFRLNLQARSTSRGFVVDEW
jgi:hypothetical protein